MRTVALSTCIALASIALPASADEVDRCVAASERGQQARRRRALTEARAAFIECAADVCPAVVRAACGEWLGQVEGTLSTIVVAAVTANETDVPSPNVTLDGRRIADGSAVAVDPGAHTVDVEAQGYERATVRFVAREGERARVVRVTLARHGDASAPTRGAEPSGIRPVTWITGGLAVLALGSTAYFGATGLSRAGELRSTCAPTCPEAQRSEVATRYLIADLSLVAAIVLGGVSVWTLVSTPSAVDGRQR